jgi:hydroxyacyl-ACP dehydratase HTD2-like protein with hotdog domain
MVDHSALGRTGTPFEMDVERGKIREFARATLAPLPEYLSEHPVAPPTFLTTTFFWQDGDANPWAAVAMNQERGLHAEQEFVFHGPPPTAGTRLHCQSRIDQIFEKQGRRGGVLTFVVMVTEFRDDGGQLVAESRMTGVETARPPEETP